MDYLVAEWLHFDSYWDNGIPYQTESVHFFDGGFMNSETKMGAKP